MIYFPLCHVYGKYEKQKQTKIAFNGENWFSRMNLIDLLAVFHLVNKLIQVSVL